jgi:hypothetical protein
MSDFNNTLIILGATPMTLLAGAMLPMMFDSYGMGGSMKDVEIILSFGAIMLLSPVIVSVAVVTDVLYTATFPVRFIANSLRYGKWSKVGLMRFM